MLILCFPIFLICDCKDGYISEKGCIRLCIFFCRDLLTAGQENHIDINCKIL